MAGAILGQQGVHIAVVADGEVTVGGLLRRRSAELAVGIGGDASRLVAAVVQAYRDVGGREVAPVAAHRRGAEGEDLFAYVDAVVQRERVRLPLGMDREGPGARRQ